MASRTDIPMKGLHVAQRDLEQLDRSIALGHITSVEFIRSVILGIVIKLDVAIVEINES